MCGLLSVIFFIIGLFKTGYELISLLGVSALFAIADALYSIKEKIEEEK